MMMKMLVERRRETTWTSLASNLTRDERGWGKKADKYGRTPDREGAPDPAISGAEAASLASHANAFACINAAPACTSRVTVLRGAVCSRLKTPCKVNLDHHQQHVAKPSSDYDYSVAGHYQQQHPLMNP